MSNTKSPCDSCKNSNTICCTGEECEDYRKYTIDSFEKETIWDPRDRWDYCCTRCNNRGSAPNTHIIWQCNKCNAAVHKVWDTATELEFYKQVIRDIQDEMSVDYGTDAFSSYNRVMAIRDILDRCKEKV